MSEIKITKSDIHPPRPSPVEIPDLATLRKEIEAAHTRLNFVTDLVQELVERFDRHIEQEKSVLGIHRDEIESLREMVATLWDKVMTGHQEFLRKVDGIFNPKKKPKED